MTLYPSLEELFAKTQLGDVGLIGDPVNHSLSPLIQNTAFQTWKGAFQDRNEPTPTYHLFHVTKDLLGRAVDLMRQHHLRGLNVTVPHKIDVCRFVDFLEPFAKRSGSVNTLCFSGKKVSGYNTDADGFKRALSWDLDFNPEGKTALVLGAGGTGRVVALSLLDMMVHKIFLWNRDPKKLEDILSLEDEEIEKIVPARSAEDLAAAVASSDLIVNATSLGLSEGDGIPGTNIQFSSDHVVFDVVYHRETAFLAAAKKAGARTADGSGMLVYQGARSFEIWTGTPAPVDVMRATLMKSLGKGSVQI